MKEQTYTKCVLAHLEETDPKAYLTSSRQRKLLGYPARNQEDWPIETVEMIALDCEMVETTNGTQLCQILIMDASENVLYSEWVRPKHEIIDYVTHITGLTKESFIAKQPIQFGDSVIKQVQKAIEGKVIVGHDLANDLRVLPIQHNHFIDTIDLYPHNFGLPSKNKLKHLALEHLGRPIQWHSHDSKEDAKAALDLARLHIQNGRGTIKEVECIVPPAHYSIQQIISESQLNLEKIQGLFLRGSRALQLVLDQKDYTSDWDYYCIYNTSSTINGKLIKLYNTDITIYDLKTFNKYLSQNNDLPMLQLFFLPKEYQFINKLTLPKIELGLARQSLGYHIGKCERKLKRFREMPEGPKKDWKLLKVLHLQLRFLDYFLQLHQFGSIVEVKRSKKIWEEAKQLYIDSGSFDQAEKWLKEQVKCYYQEVRKVHKSHRPLRHLSQENYKNKQQKVTNFQVKAKQSNRDEIYYMLKSYVLNLESFGSNPLKLALVDQLLANGLDNMEDYKIGYNRHKLYPNLIQFHYLQSASFERPLCRESRGIILDQSRNYKVVALPYFKFFDYNDSKYCQLSKFDFSQCSVYEKHDGSIAVLYHYEGVWWVSSSRVPDGSNNYCFARPETTTQFKNQFWKIFHKLGFKMPGQEDKQLTFIFQILSKDHIIVVRREESNLVLHGVVNRSTGQQVNPLDFREKYGWRTSEPLNIPIKSIEEAVKIVETLNPMKQEGFILRDKNNLRIKVKSAGYLRANWLAELNLTPLKNPRKYILIEVVLSGDHQTFCGYCPEWKPLVQQILNKVKYLNEECERIYQQIKDLNKKERSLQIGKCNKVLHPFIFALCENYHKWHNQLHTLMPPKKINDYLDRITQ